MRNALKDLTKANKANEEFFKAAAGENQLSLRMGGGNWLLHCPEGLYGMIVNPSEEVIQAKLGVFAVAVTQLLYGQDKKIENYHTACQFIKLLRELKTKVDSGELTEKQAVNQAHENRHGNTKLKTEKVSAEEAEILRQLRSGELKF